MEENQEKRSEWYLTETKWISGGEGSTLLTGVEANQDTMKERKDKKNCNSAKKCRDNIPQESVKDTQPEYDT